MTTTHHKENAMTTTTTTMTIEMPIADAALIMRSLIAARADASNILNCNEEKAQQRIGDAFARVSAAELTRDGCRFETDDREMLTMMDTVCDVIYTDADEIPTDKIRSILLQMQRAYFDNNATSVIIA